MAPVKLDYTDTEFQAIITPLARSSGVRPVDAQLVRTGLIELLASSSIVLEGEFDAVFEELAGVQPAEKLLSDVYERLQDRDSIALRSPGPDMSRRVAAMLSAELRQKVRRRGLPHQSVKVRYNATRRTLQIIGFECRPDLRAEICSELAIYHQQCIRQGRAQDTNLDTLLFELADIFVDATGFKLDPLELPHGNRSHFIKFASASLVPFIKHTQVEPLALGKRWDRMKQHHSTGL